MIKTRFLMIFLLITSFSFQASGQKNRFEPDYFIKKHDLKLPVIADSMLNVSKHTHASDTWEYWYIKDTEKIDSVVRHLSIERFRPSWRCEKYTYQADSVIVNAISMTVNKKDTITHALRTFWDDFKIKKSIDLMDNRIFISKFTNWGMCIYDKNRFQNEKEFRGTEIPLTEHDDYIESIPIRRGVPDSNNIRRHYFTPFDSVVADFLVEKKNPPIFFNFHVFNENQKPTYKYGFDVFRETNPIVAINYHTYDKANRLQRIYFFDAKEYRAPEKGFELTNYTQFVYDKRGRLIRKTTRVEPDPKPEEGEK